MKNIQQGLDGIVGAEIGKALDGPVTYVLVRIVHGVQQYPGGALGLNPPIAKQTDIPKRIGSWTLLAIPGGRFKIVHAGGGLFPRFLDRC